jgi:beta-glucosidase
MSPALPDTSTPDSSVKAPLELRARLTAGAAMWSTPAVPELGAPSLTLADGPMGVASGRVDERDVSTLTPSGVALGASWNVDLVARIGALVGGEAGRLGVDLVLAPNLNLPRSPLAGRAFEMFSEDPLLTGLLGAAWVRGLQSTGAGAVAKHLVCNDSETQRASLNAVVDERPLREVYLAPFKLAAEAGCAGILTAYNRMNGPWCAEHRQVLTDIVKGEWGFEGLTVSDWFGTHSIASANAGLDLEMPGPARFLGTKVAEAVAAGEVAEARLDDAVARIVSTARRFTGPKTPPLAPAEADALLVEAAAAGFTLLRNEGGLLPLVPGADRTVAVIGPNAVSPCFQGGTFAKIAVRPDAPRPLDALRARYGDHCTLLFEPGVDPAPRLPAMPVAPVRDLGDGASQGMTVDYFDNPEFTGPPVASETRATNSLTWFVGMHEMGVWDRPAGVRASGRYTPRQDGPHFFYVGATGSVRLRIDGRIALERELEIAPADIMGVLKSGEADSVEIDLVAGRTVEVTVEFPYRPARVQGLWYGVRGPDKAPELLARAVAAARAADAVILVVGETADSGVESKDRESTALDPGQIALIEAVSAANPRTVIVANVGHAFDTRWEDRAPALLLTWYPGEGFGPALAQVLAGDREPGGRLPVVIARRDADYPAFDLTPDAKGDLLYAEGLGVGWRGLAARGVEPRHGFGAGFGYARFALADARVAPGPDGGVTVSVEVANVSDRTGAEVVQVYRDGPEPALLGFGRVELAPGARARVDVEIPRARFLSWIEGAWRAPGAPVRLKLGRSSRDTPFRLTAAID